MTEQHGVRVPKDGSWEDPAEGCPAGWRRSRYLASLEPFRRTRTQTGARVPNPLFDTCDDPAIWQAIALLEEEEERCIAHRMRLEAAELAKPLEAARERGGKSQGDRRPRRARRRA